MPLQVTKTPQAWRDVVELASFIAEDNLDAAERFLDAVEQTFALLASMPMMGRMCEFESPQAQGLRMWRIRGFERYLVFYRPIDKGINVVRVLHGSRDIERLFED
jgi:toxin ParE1/3/4